MILWRIAATPSLEGRGAERAPGRWHTAGLGKRAVYLAEHPAVALVENLVNLQYSPAHWPPAFELLRIEADDGVGVAEWAPRPLPSGWRDDIESTRAAGDRWLAAGESALLRIPSAPAPESWNYLFNPRHPQAQRVRLAWHRPLRYDQRLFRADAPA